MNERGGKKVVDIQFYQQDKLPLPLAEEAKKQGVALKKGIVAVKLILSSPPTYKFVSIGRKPSEFKKFLSKIAREDGENLDKALERAFGERT